LAVIGTPSIETEGRRRGIVSGEGEGEKKEKGREWLGYNYDSR
jgi:hypothetical protein